MKRIFILFAFLLALAAGLVAQKHSWELIFLDVNDAKIYLDYETRVYSADNVYVSFWTKHVEKGGDYNLDHAQTNSSSRQLRLLSFARYDKDGKLIYSHDATPEWHDIIPETLGDALLHQLYAVK